VSDPMPDIMCVHEPKDAQTIPMFVEDLLVDAVCTSPTGPAIDAFVISRFAPWRFHVAALRLNLDGQYTVHYGSTIRPGAFIVHLYERVWAGEGSQVPERLPDQPSVYFYLRILACC
jgi:hypothetical protein